MQIVKAGYELWDPFSGESLTKKIEKVARVCYKSEDKICEGSDARMVRNLVKGKHYAMLEHGTVIVEADEVGYFHFLNILGHIRADRGEVPMLRYTDVEYSGRYIISGNCRAWREFLELCEKLYIAVSGELEDILTPYKYSTIFGGIEVRSKDKGLFRELDPKYLSSKEKLVHLDLTVKFTVDRGISHEIVRHRKASFAQESTRYCNYGSKGGEITVIEPCYLMVDGVKVSVENWSERYGAWVSACEEAEKNYLKMLADGATPQEARAVLPTSLKTEVVMTANVMEWRHFFNLRALGTTGKPHPQIVEVAMPLLHEMQEKFPLQFDDLGA